MRLYFAADSGAEEKFQKRFSDIITLLNDSGVLVMSNLADKNLSGFSAQDLEKIEQEGMVMLEKMDGLIIEGSSPLPESGYLIAIALTHQKPVLYLADKTRPINKNLLHLKQDKNAGKYLTLINYSEKDLAEIIVGFLQTAEHGEGRELPTIKFTLRITPRIERYLQWKTHNTKISKADFLRELIEGLIDRDEEYKKFSGK